MKKRILALVMSLVLVFTGAVFYEGKYVSAAAGIKIDSSDTFFNSKFRNYVSKNFDTDGDGYLSQEEIDKVTSIDISGLGVTALNGMEYFTGLQTLNISGNSLSSISLQNENLVSLDCSNTGVTTLNISKCIKLKKLNCSNNSKLSALDVSKCTALSYLNCDNDTAISGLNLTANTGLTELSCKGMTGLGSIDVSKNTSLQVLNIAGDTKITSLSLVNNTNLTSLNCSDVKLGSLDLKANKKLQYLSCANTGISALDLSGHTALVEIYCKGNSIKELELSGNKNLAYLSCYDNPLENLALPETAMQKGLNSGSLAVFSSNTVVAEGAANVSISSGQEKSGFICYTPGSVKLLSLSDISGVGVVGYSYNGTDKVLKITSMGIEAGDVKAPEDCNHIFRDYTHKVPMADTSVRVYGNAATVKNKDGVKINKRSVTLYTDIRASYIYTEKKGSVTAKTGKVIAGLTMTNVKPVLGKKSKIEDSQAADIAKVKIKSGMITVTATGKQSGVVYLWVMDTGSEGDFEMCPINVAMGPKKIQLKDKAYDDPSGAQLKNPKFESGSKLNVFLNPMGGDGNSTSDCTYTVEIDKKSQKYASIEEDSSVTYGYIITSIGTPVKKNTKITINVTCDQTGKTYKAYAVITPILAVPEPEKE